MKKTRIFLFLFFLILFSQAYAQKPDALVLFKLGKYKDAIAVCEQELKASPRNIESYVVLSWALIADKQYEKAYETAKSGRDIMQYDPRLTESQAEACFFLGRNTEALNLFQSYISYAPSGIRMAEVYYFMGEIYLRMAKFCHADIAFTTAVQSNSLDGMWWARLGYAREQAKDYIHALRAYDKALELNKNHVDAQKGKERVLKFFQ